MFRHPSRFLPIPPKEKPLPDEVADELAVPVMLTPSEIRYLIDLVQVDAGEHYKDPVGLTQRLEGAGDGN